MELNELYVVIINATGTHKALAPMFKKHGYKCLHVLTRDDLIDHQHNYIPKDFVLTLFFSTFKDIYQLVEHLKKYNICHIIPGCESSVKFASNLGYLFGINDSDPKKLKARYNKYYMQKSLQEDGINSTAQIRSNSADEVIKWFKLQPFSKVILKPEEAAASDKVSLCTTEDEIKRAVKEIVNKKTNIRVLSKYVVCQEYLEGPQYIVNSISVAGQHFVTDIWEVGYENRCNLTWGGYQKLLNPNAHEHKILINYIKPVLTSVGVGTEFCCCEVRLTSRGPVLVEINMRLPGTYDIDTISKATGYHATELLVLAYINPEKAIQMLQTKHSTKHIMTVFCYAKETKKISNSPNTNKFQILPSYEKINLYIKKGDMFDISSWKSSLYGFALLLNDNEELLMNDYKHFREIEKEFYKEMLYN